MRHSKRHHRPLRHLGTLGVTVLFLSNAQCTKCSTDRPRFQPTSADIAPAAIASGIRIAAARIQDATTARVALDCTAVALPAALFGIALDYEIVGSARFVAFEPASGTTNLVAGGAKEAAREVISIGVAGASSTSNIGGSYAIGTLVVEVDGPGDYTLRARTGSVAGFAAGGAVLAATNAPSVSVDTLVIR